MVNGGLTFSAASERNKAPILDVLRKVLPAEGKVLEIGSGSGQHIVFFAPLFPQLTWQPSDLACNLDSLNSRIGKEGSPNILQALELDVLCSWPDSKFNVVFSSNTAHIMSWQAVCAMFAGIADVLLPEGLFCLYGPFNEGGLYTSGSNEQFDSDLRARDSSMGLRDLAALELLAGRHQITLMEKFHMPANNQILLFRKIQA